MEKAAFSTSDGSTTLFLCGDVMTGRGIDQLFSTSVDPRLYERYVKNAERYVQLGLRESGRLELPVSHDYIWGDALGVWKAVDPAFRIINLETSITTSDDFAETKGIHYRMHPDNAPCLTAAEIDACILANNHVLDWGIKGLKETLHTLDKADIAYAGAGHDVKEAAGPVALRIDGEQRILIFSYGLPSSGIPATWAAREDRPGVNWLPDLSVSSLQRVKDDIAGYAREGDLLICSIHWGGNWGYAIPDAHRRFARSLIDESGVDVIHGHSSHHPMGVEVFNDRLILYGCGDFLNDYEGIGGHQEYRPELTLMYFPTLDTESGALLDLHLAPMVIKRFRLHRASKSQAGWLADRLSREGKALGTSVKRGKNGFLVLEW